MAYALAIAEQRHKRPPTSRPLASGADALGGDVVGTMAEIATCRFYGEDPYRWVKAYDSRPGAIPDLQHAGCLVSVKGRSRWKLPLDLIVPDYDLDNDIYVLVSVDVPSHWCGMRGWITQELLLSYPEREWQWTDDRPGATRPDEKRRYVPVEDLRPCTRR